ncbi:MAG: hypothetical protein KDD70_16375, partial [Bdellovibrionales bacterium]|nr:hypothetical protein [Bdellovibrionales bacterium]
LKASLPEEIVTKEKSQMFHDCTRKVLGYLAFAVTYESTPDVRSEEVIQRALRAGQRAFPSFKQFFGELEFNLDSYLVDTTAARDRAVGGLSSLVPVCAEEIVLGVIERRQYLEGVAMLQRAVLPRNNLEEKHWNNPLNEIVESATSKPIFALSKPFEGIPESAGNLSHAQLFQFRLIEKISQAQQGAEWYIQRPQDFVRSLRHHVVQVAKVTSETEFPKALIDVLNSKVPLAPHQIPSRFGIGEEVLAAPGIVRDLGWLSGLQNLLRSRRIQVTEFSLEEVGEVKEKNEKLVQAVLDRAARGVPQMILGWNSFFLGGNVEEATRKAWNERAATFLHFESRIDSDFCSTVLLHHAIPHAVNEAAKSRGWGVGQSVSIPIDADRMDEFRGAFHKGNFQPRITHGALHRGHIQPHGKTGLEFLFEPGELRSDLWATGIVVSSCDDFTTTEEEASSPEESVDRPISPTNLVPA